jgi:hypothetical protein
MMKQKAGLGKKVSSIFDGVSLPNIMRSAEQTPPQVPPAYRPPDVVSQPCPVQAAPPIPPKTAAVAVPQMPRTVSPPPPQPKAAAHVQPSRHSGSFASTVAVSGDSWQQSIYKIFFSGNGEADARNRKALAMVGMLLVVLVAVVMWTGVFSSSPSKSAISPVAMASANSELNINWTTPEPWPSTLRDPMRVGSAPPSSSGGPVAPLGGDSGSLSGMGLVVKSIVYVANDPKSSTALINGEILRVGKSFNGATLTKINKDSVEFSANGKSWKQQVE